MSASTRLDSFPWPLTWHAAVALFTLLIAATPCPAQRRPWNPPPDGPWNRRGSDPTDAAKQTEAQQRKAREYLDAGNRLLEKGDIQGAKTKFKAVVELAGAEGVGQAALGQLQNIHNRGLRELQRAESMFQEGKYAESLQLAKRTKVLYAAIFDGIPGGGNQPNIANLAVSLIERIEADPKAAAQFREERAAKLCRRVPGLEKAAEQEPRKYFDLCRALEKVAGKYPDCPSGQQCAKRLRELKKDPKLYALIQREADRRFIAATLARAEEYELAGQSDLAAAEYEKLKKKHPDKPLPELRRMAKEKADPSG